MKKKSFFSGVNAKLALATVALTSVMFTSCEKEEFNVAPVELDPASATIAITVYDLGDRSIITEGLNITGDTEVKAGADGKIAPETRKKVYCYKKRLFTRRGTSCDSCFE